MKITVTVKTEMNGATSTYTASASVGHPAQNFDFSDPTDSLPSDADIIKGIAIKLFESIIASEKT
tara:strand:- start:560 stop:754 length:195 start_codon:yes stop_codon:yes gene_type:complete